MSQNQQDIIATIRAEYGNLSGRGGRENLTNALLDGIFPAADLIAAGARPGTLRQTSMDIKWVNEHKLINANNITVSKIVISHRGGRGNNDQDNIDRINRLLKIMRARGQQTISVIAPLKTKPVKNPKKTKQKSRRNGKPGQVYVAYNENYKDGIYKIGFTNDHVENRLNSLSKSTGVPGRFWIMHVISVADAYEVEQQLHTDLQDYRVDKEFFEVPDPAIIKEAMNRLWMRNK